MINAARCEALLQGATPEEHARLEEDEATSAAAKSFGTDPTAVNRVL